MRLISVHSYLGAGVTTDRCQFTLFYLFYFSLFFCILFACLRFGSHFRSHDYGRAKRPFFVVVFLQDQTVLQRTRTRTRTLYILSNIFGASTGSSIQGIECFNQGSICGTHNATSSDLRIYSCVCFP